MDAALPLHTIIAELDDLGCTISVKDGQPHVSQPKLALHRARFEVLLRSLRARRDEVLERFAGIEHGEPEHCDDCHATVFVQSPEVQRMCQMLMCPYWRKDCGVGGDWLAKARNDERWRQRGKK